jgi:hypothetical protein
VSDASRVQGAGLMSVAKNGWEELWEYCYAVRVQCLSSHPCRQIGEDFVRY